MVQRSVYYSGNHIKHFWVSKSTWQALKCKPGTSSLHNACCKKERVRYHPTMHCKMWMMYTLYSSKSALWYACESTRIVQTMTYCQSTAPISIWTQFCICSISIDYHSKQSTKNQKVWNMYDIYLYTTNGIKLLDSKSTTALNLHSENISWLKFHCCP